MTSLPVIEAIAGVASWGLPFRRLLTVSDPVEVVIEQHIAARAVKASAATAEAIADRVGSAVAKALGG